jgi:predicted CoA-binding protein
LLEGHKIVLSTQEEYALFLNLIFKNLQEIMKKTVVFGASPNVSRYANLACHMLDEAGFEFIPVGIKKGEILGKSILDLRTKPPIEQVHTITIYLNPSHQKEWYEYILSLKPKRLIFNPGAENKELRGMAEIQGIEVEYTCTLVLLRTGQF